MTRNQGHKPLISWVDQAKCGSAVRSAGWAYGPGAEGRGRADVVDDVDEQAAGLLDLVVAQGLA